MKWRYSSSCSSAPIIGPDTTIYVGRSDYLRAYTAAGKFKWSFYTNCTVYSTPAIDADGSLYFGGYDGNLYAVNSQGERLWEYPAGNYIYSSPALSGNGTLYIGSSDGKLYAISIAGSGLADSPWPKFQQNAQNSGQMNTLLITDKFEFGFSTNTYVKSVAVTNATPSDITIKSGAFSNPAFTIATGLPKSIQRGATDSLRLTIRVDSTAVYRSTCELTYSSGGTDKKCRKSFSAGLFRENNDERTLIAHQAYDMYQQTLASSSSSIATQNNLGLLYYLVGDLNDADIELKKAFDRSTGASYAYDGVGLNMGALRSDQDQSEDAKSFYGFTISHGSNLMAKKAYYNLAWQAFMEDSLEKAATFVQETLIGTSANDFLLAKAYVLRGAIRYRVGDYTGAASDWNSAKTYDPDGPIGRLAMENFTTAVAGEAEALPKEFVLSPNYPNPFNPETVISFGLPKKCHVLIDIFNVKGQRVRRLVDEQRDAGWHQVSWDGKNDTGLKIGSGVYLLYFHTEEFKQLHKMTLLR
ncbi:PQQ-binding-like beta-propeller repeat protein, partial [candidate division KSB1 bacterium]|nr:PQQ-binding-like beta-propeller repeat protein [candidate division KSB1 bacterium]